MRRAAKRDANEQPIIRALESAGCLVYQTDRPTDLLVQRASHLYLLEIKDRAGTLTPAQSAFIAQGWHVHIVRSPSEALAAVGLINPPPHRTATTPLP